MLSFGPQASVFLVVGVTDLRKSFDTLASVVEHHLERDPLSGVIYLFSNRRRDRIKALYWDGSGLWVSAKRLEKGTFFWPESDEKAVSLSIEELTLLIGGIDLGRARRRQWYRRERKTSLVERLS